MLMYVSHELDLKFSSPITEGAFELRIAPRVDSNQALREFRLEVEPNVTVYEYLDWQCNRVHHFSLNGSHNRVIITATSSIDIQTLASRLDGLSDNLTNLESDHRVRRVRRQA